MLVAIFARKKNPVLQVVQAVAFIQAWQPDEQGWQVLLVMKVALGQTVQFVEAP